MKLSPKQVWILIIIVMAVIAAGLWALTQQNPLKNFSVPSGWTSLEAGNVILVQDEAKTKWFSLEPLPKAQCASGEVEKRIVLTSEEEQPDVTYVYHDSVLEAVWQQPGQDGPEQRWCFTRDYQAKSVEIATSATDEATRELIVQQIIPSLYPELADN